jgi:hypothetical protein
MPSDNEHQAVRLGEIRAELAALEPGPGTAERARALTAEYRRLSRPRAPAAEPGPTEAERWNRVVTMRRGHPLFGRVIA